MTDSDDSITTVIKSWTKKAKAPQLHFGGGGSKGTGKNLFAAYWNPIMPSKMHQQHGKWSFSCGFPPSNSLYICIWILLPFILFSLSLNLWLSFRGTGSVMCLQRRHGCAHWIPLLLSRQTRRISFLGDAINLDFISKRADHGGDAAIKDFSPSWPVRMPLWARGHFKCKHGLSGSVYLKMTHWLVAHVSLSRLK